MTIQLASSLGATLLRLMTGVGGASRPDKNDWHTVRQFIYVTKVLRGHEYLYKPEGVTGLAL